MKRSPLTAAAWVAVLAVIVLRASPAGAADDPASVLVQTTPLVAGSLPRTIMAYGTARPAPAARIALMAPAAAIVAAVYVHTGEPVAKGAPLIELRPTPASAADYAAAASAQRVARDALVRTRQLRAERLATEQQLAAAEKAASDASAALAALSAQGGGGPKILRAPDAAVVTALTASRQAIVAAGAPLIELAQAHGLVLVVGVVPAQALAISVGGAAVIDPIGGRGHIMGRVTMRGAAVDAASGLVPIDIALASDAMLPGEAAEASITVAQVPGYVVPHQAILVNQSGGTYVVQVEGGAAKTVPVRVLVAGGARDVIAGALDRGAPVVLAGAYQLQNGMKVRYAGAVAKGGR
ncbi:MAG TPA: hypothetical protein VMU86_09120 [Steroidobacteraceae bacterium]|nr:hypothetical protein [Steroidobacteraceae bacterium]